VGGGGRRHALRGGGAWGGAEREVVTGEWEEREVVTGVAADAGVDALSHSPPSERDPPPHPLPPPPSFESRGLPPASTETVDTAAARCVRAAGAWRRNA
jgi:hypothetical protein